jgi:hypothetical protein
MEQGFTDRIQKMVNGYGKDTLLDARRSYGKRKET